MLLLTHPQTRRFASGKESVAAGHENLVQSFLRLGPDELASLEALGKRHHVVMRSFLRIQEITAHLENSDRAVGIQNVIERERRRIDRALCALEAICRSFESEGRDVIVIKSLDHWPDMGNDLDLYTDAPATEIIAIMKRRFNAGLAPRSWGDCLAAKWNFVIPGLPELVEVHVGRLGQTGEQIEIAKALCRRARRIEIGPHSFRIPAAEDQLLIATLQRMYRHFYLRLCDIADRVEVLDAGVVDYETLRESAEAGGIWRGVATYLAIVSGYMESCRGWGVPLPPFVRASAQFGAGKIRFAEDFLRVPLVPQSLELLAHQFKQLVMKGRLRSSARLSLFPGLAAAAALGFRLTGSDKGIW